MRTPHGTKNIVRRSSLFISKNQPQTNLHSTMPGRAKSIEDKRRTARQVHDTLMLKAVTAYKKELKKPAKSQSSLRKICLEIEALHFSETGSVSKLSSSTLLRLVKGGKTCEDALEERAWLNVGESDVVIDFTIEMGHRGFPLSHRRLKEHVDLICRARHGSKFPAIGVGINWTYRFSKRHSTRLKITRSRPLEDKRGRAVNPHTNAAYWPILSDSLTDYAIKQHNLYGSDEIGVQTQGGGERETVFAEQGKGTPYQQRAGTRENITVIVTICADGTSTPPAVIFKGSAYQVKWAQNNPLNAS